MGKGLLFLRTHKLRSGKPALRVAGLLGMALLCLPLASAAGRFGVDTQDGIVEIAAGVGMRDLTPMAGTNSQTPSTDFILKDCMETDQWSNQQSAVRGVDPAYMLKNYFSSINVSVELADVKTLLLQGTQHGKIYSWVDSSGLISYHYDPVPGFLGDDQAVFMAAYGGKHFKIVLTIRVLDIIDTKSSTCFDPVMIKAPKPTSGMSGFYEWGQLAPA